MKTIKHHITDPPMILRSNDVLENTRFIATGSAYGRFLFNEGVAVHAEGDNITIRACVFEGDFGGKLYTRRRRLQLRLQQVVRDARFLQSVVRGDWRILWYLLRLNLRARLRG